ncbi:DUF3455 domain-containing protein [Methylocapsa acidiphila]|uniref:DUF3455 domain-containing protein n=1 Tax=Methylocapsa acidiphila TaxID=133552 RepID=UPI00041B1393|nr:DUF3455 domain-containing protein [Methylocapsa acidiphila]
MKRLILALAVCGLADGVMAEESLTPPADAKLLFELGADGIQVYACEAKDQGFAWVFQEPAANLFDAEGRQIGTHSKGPSWTLSDSSSATAELIAKQAAAQKGAVPWLLLKVKTHDGAGRLANAAYIRRIDTKGGAEPASGCDAAHKGEAARIRYSATYQFFGQ